MLMQMNALENTSVVNKDYSERIGLLGIKLCNKQSDHTCIVYSSYLSRETSPWGRDGVSIFAHRMSLMYIFSDTGNGDFNDWIEVYK